MAKPTPIRRNQKTPKAVRKAASTAAPAAPGFSLSAQTLQLAHEAIVQMRKPNAQVTMVCAQAMNEIETVLAIAGQQTRAQQEAEAKAKAEADAAPDAKKK